MYRLAELLVIVLVTAYGTAQCSAVSIAAPLFAFGSEQYFSSGAGVPRASFRVHDDYKETLHNIVRGALQFTPPVTETDGLNNAGLQHHKPNTVLIVLGNQLRTSDLRSKAMQKALQPLDSLLKQAKSSYLAPYILHQNGMLDDHVELQRLTSSSTQTVVVGCDVENHRSLEEAVQQLRAVPAVLVFCTKVDEGLGGSSHGIEEEMKQLQKAHLAAAARGDRQITIYASRPVIAVSVQQRRLMQAANADVGVCGQLCQTQVKWLEGILAALILAIAAFSGMSCLYMLDTPTRFDKPKEGARTD